MEPCWTPSMIPRRTILRRPFPVRPFLSTYSTEQLATFMRVHLDTPFNTRFARFIEVVNMTGADFVRLSDKDLGRLCDGEGAHLYDLTTFQKSLRPPLSPHVRDIFSLPPSPKLPQKPPDPCGLVPDLEFDFSEEQNVSNFDNETSEYSDPSSPDPLDQGLPDVITDDDASDDESLASLPVRALPPFTTRPSSLDEKPHDADSLIDLFSPLPPLPPSELGDGNSSDEALSPESQGIIHDVFDSPHLSTLSPLASPYHSDVGDNVDILGLGLSSNEVAAAKPAPIPPYSPVFGDDFDPGYGPEPIDPRPLAAQETPRLAPTSPSDPSPLDIGQPFSPHHASEGCLPAVPFTAPVHCPSDSHGTADMPVAPEDNPMDLSPLVDSGNGPDRHPSVNFLSPGAWRKSLSPTDDDLELSGFLPPAPSEDLHYESELEGEDPASGGAAGLSAFMSDLRSLDSSPPSFSSPPHLDSPCPYYTLSLSQVFSDRDILSGGSLGLSISPELTIIQTPVTSAFGYDDNVLIASPSTTYHHHHAHGPYHFSDALDPEQVAFKTQTFGGAAGKGSYSTLRAQPSLAPDLAHQEPQATSSAVRRPKIEVVIPNLPSLLEDEQLSCLMSSIELARVKSRNGSQTSLVQPEPSPGPSWLSHDRSIWPVSSSSGHSRFLPSPYMKEKEKDVPGSSTSVTAPGLQRTKSLGTVSEDLTEAAAEFTSAPAEGSDAPSPRDTISQTHQQQASGSAGWCKVGEYIRTMLSPSVSSGDSVSRGAGHVNEGDPVIPGGLAL